MVVRAGVLVGIGVLALGPRGDVLRAKRCGTFAVALGDRRLILRALRVSGLRLRRVRVLGHAVGVPGAATTEPSGPGRGFVRRSVRHLRGVACADHRLTREGRTSAAHHRCAERVLRLTPSTSSKENE